MGAGIAARRAAAASAVVTEPVVLGLNQREWQRAEGRLFDFLTAMGLKDGEEIARITARVRERLEIRAAALVLENPLEAAIEEAHASLDRWLIAEVGGEIGADALCAAREAVLSGNVPGWSARWAGLSDQPVTAAIRAYSIAPVPERAPLVMAASRIDPCCHRLRRRIAAAIRFFFGRPARAR